MNQLDIKVTKDEAIVLFELLSRYSKTDVLSVEHKAVQLAVWNLTCLFEKNIAKAFDIDYQEALHAARLKLQNED